MVWRHVELCRLCTQCTAKSVGVRLDVLKIVFSRQCKPRQSENLHSCVLWYGFSSLWLLVGAATGVRAHALADDQGPWLFLEHIGQAIRSIVASILRQAALFPSRRSRSCDREVCCSHLPHACRPKSHNCLQGSASSYSSSHCSHKHDLNSKPSANPQSFAQSVRRRRG